MSEIFVLASYTLAKVRLVFIGLKLAKSKMREGRSEL
jgi:hypothetical protein